MLIEERRRKLKSFVGSLSKEERTKLLIEARILDEQGHLHQRLQESKESEKDKSASKGA